MEFIITSIAVETDYGTSTATNSSAFNVMITEPFGVGQGEGVAPYSPILTVSDQFGTEDMKVTLDLYADADPDDPTNPKISIVLSDLPEGARIEGVTVNPLTGKYVAAIEDIEAGLVRILPPADFSGEMIVTVEAVATNSWAITRSSGPQAVTFVL